MFHESPEYDQNWIQMLVNEHIAGEQCLSDGRLYL